MNHDNVLDILSMALEVVIFRYQKEITAIEDPKHRTELVQEFEKAEHYMLKMAEYLDDLNRWFTAFGVDGNAQNS